MKLQAVHERDLRVVEAFIDARRGFDDPVPPLKLSWSNWGFGRERLEDSAARLSRFGVPYIELHGNLYGPDLGYDATRVRSVLDAHGLQVSGVCGMVMPEQEFASSSPAVRQRAIDYFRRQAEFCAEAGGSYLLFGAAAVGRPVPYDDQELARAADTMRIVAPDFERLGVVGAVEPIRPDETSLVHTFGQARKLIALVDHPGIGHINGDLYHMLAGEEHIGLALLEAGDELVNLHLADTNRRALGSGLLDLDIVIMALYAAGHHDGDRFCSAEPLGSSANPYAAMHGLPDPKELDGLVAATARTWHERVAAVLAASDEELRAGRAAQDPQPAA